MYMYICAYHVQVHVHNNFVCAQKHSVPYKTMLYVISEYKVCLLNKYVVENYTSYKLNTRLVRLPNIRSRALTECMHASMPLHIHVHLLQCTCTCM